MLKDNIDEFDRMLVDKSVPFSVVFELTYRCNQKCVHCYQYSPGEELGLEKIKDILCQLEGKGCLYVSFTGGEPLLREDFWQIAGFARERNFAIDLLTNGTLIDEKTAKKIADLNFASVQISMLGATEQTHDKIACLKGSFKKVMRAIGYLQKEKVRIILKTSLMKDNFHELEKLKIFGEMPAVHHHLISPLIFPKNDKNKAPLALRLSDKELDKYFDVFYERFGNLAQELENEQRCSQLCYYGRTFCCINPKGEVYPCVAVPVVAGDLKKEKFDAIWEKSEELEYLRATTIDNLTECKACKYTKLCYRCGGLAYLEGRGFRGRDPEACRMAEIQKQNRERRGYEKEKIHQTQNDGAPVK